MQLKPGTLLQRGKYKIVCFLSSGGFGNTYEAELCFIHKRVAIKEFFVKNFCSRDAETSLVSVSTPSNLPLVDKLKQKFVDEAASIWQFNHPNIVRVTDVFEENATAYYVMDYIDGMSLHSMLKRDGAMPEAKALRYIKQVAEALQYVHSKNRLHLDVKPGNIMVDDSDNAILIDFGASKQYDEQGENTSTLLGLNTLGYAPVEQMSRSFSDFNTSADVYALGATLYKLLTNITPPEAVLLMTGDEELSPLPTHTSQAVRDAIANAMIPQRKRRTQTVQEFLEYFKGQVTDVKSSQEETVVIVSSPDDERTVIENPVLAQDIVEVDDSVLSLDVEGVSFKMIKVEGGTFNMKEMIYTGFLGLTQKEIIQRTTLSDYYIGETQVTQTLWDAVMKGLYSASEHENLPVVNVSWNDCNEFVAKLNSLTGRKFRLPTEAEWEFAARGGNKSNHYKYSGSDNLDEVAWHIGNSNGSLHVVGTKRPNELGLYDMSGNVSEWCQDKYGEYKEGTIANPTGPVDGSYSVVVRGGDMDSYPLACRTSHRNNSFPVLRSDNIGLRLAMIL